MKLFKHLTAIIAVTIMATLLVGCLEDVPGTTSESTPIQSSAYVEREGENVVAITVDSEYMDLTQKTLVDYMTQLSQDNAIEFEISDGMIKSIYGKENSVIKNSYWMLYTSDGDNANTSWGTYEYKGQTYGSATVGAEELSIKDDCVYVWVYSSF